MTAPDKIYIHEASAPELNVPIPYGIEYIRKNALLEWAKENHKRMVDVHSDYTKIYDEYFRGLIEKIESL